MEGGVSVYYAVLKEYSNCDVYMCVCIHVRDKCLPLGRDLKLPRLERVWVGLHEG